MSTMLEGQMVAWRVSAKPRPRVSFLETLRVVVIVVSVAAAALYLATMSQTPALVSGLVSEATARRETAPASNDQAASAVVVTLRPSAREGRPLLP